MMSSEHLFEAENNDSPESSKPLNPGNIRSREGVHHVRHEAPSGLEGCGLSNVHHAPSAFANSTQKTMMNPKRGSSSYVNPLRMVFRKMSSNDHTNGNGGGSRNIAIDVNENVAKYGNKRLKRRRSRGIDKTTVLFIGCAALSFVGGFFWMSISLNTTSPATTQHLRHDHDQLTSQTPPQSSLQRRPPESRTEHELPSAKERNEEAKKKKKIPIFIPKFDNRSYIKSWEENVKNAGHNLQERKSYPQILGLTGWDNPNKFRQFPWVKENQGKIKKSKAHKTISDYGDIKYHSIKDEEEFAREIPEDTDDWIVPGGFDAYSIQPDGYGAGERHKQKKRKNRPHPRERVSHVGPLHPDATYDEIRAYYDDDYVTLQRTLNNKTKKARACQSQSMAFLYFPTCNSFHELALGRPYDDPEEYVRPRAENSMKIKYLNHGFYRDVWIMEDSPWLWPTHHAEEEEPDEKFGVLDEAGTAELVTKAYRSAALKTFRWNQEMSIDNWEMIQVEAIIMERLTESPRIMNIYGHCGFSVSVEVVPIEFEEVVVDHGGEGYYDAEKVEERNEEGIRPYNDFTPTEKLEFALEMAESLADLHGFKEGVIVHDDVQLCQWLHTTDGRLKLGDFNRATIMQWDVENEEYCRFNNGEAFGNYRAPEEFAIKNLDEKIDVFSFGNNIYALLTGLWNFYDIDDDGKVHDVLIDEKLPYVDPRFKERSYAERVLVELMEKCWVYDPNERISIFEAVNILRNAIKENAKVNSDTNNNL